MIAGERASTESVPRRPCARGSLRLFGTVQHRYGTTYFPIRRSGRTIASVGSGVVAADEATQLFQLRGRNGTTEKESGDLVL